MAKARKHGEKAMASEIAVRNAANTLFANVRFASVDEPISTIVVTSTLPGEGKTSVSVALGEAIAATGERTLLVEGDLRRRRLAMRMGVHASSGLYALMTGAVPYEAAIVKASVPGLYLLDADEAVPNPLDLLSTRRFKDLVGELKRRFSYIVFDTPPVGMFVDAAVLAALSDATVLVVKPGAAQMSELEGAYDQLEAAGAHVLGICTTFDQGAGGSAFYGYEFDEAPKKGALARRFAAKGARP